MSATFNEAIPSRRSCPSGYLVGINMWSGSNKIPGAREASKFEEAETRQSIAQKTKATACVKERSRVTIRSDRPQHSNDDEIPDVLKLPPLFIPRWKKEEVDITARELRLKVKRKAGSSSQSKLTGIWRQNVGPLMEPPNWTW